jgi:hypothetical protein
VSAVSDPGWRRAAGGLLFMVVPTKGARTTLKSANGLVLLRQLWVMLAAVITILWIPVVALSFSDALRGSIDGRVAALVVVVVAVGGQVIAARLAPSVSGVTEQVARDAAQRWVLVRVGLGELAALVGFIGFVASANPLVYVAGFVPTAAVMVAAAPSAAWIGRMQVELRESGSDVELLSALVGGGISR